MKYLEDLRDTERMDGGWSVDLYGAQKAEALQNTLTRRVYCVKILTELTSQTALVTLDPLRPSVSGDFERL